jgi:hypothetical protein
VSGSTTVSTCSKRKPDTARRYGRPPLHGKLTAGKPVAAHQLEHLPPAIGVPAQFRQPVDRSQRRVDLQRRRAETA